MPGASGVARASAYAGSRRRRIERPERGQARSQKFEHVGRSGRGMTAPCRHRPEEEPELGGSLRRNEGDELVGGQCSSQRPIPVLLAGPRIELGVEAIVNGDDEVGVVANRCLEDVAVLRVDEFEVVDLDRLASILATLDESADGGEAPGDASGLLGVAVERVASGFVDDLG